MNQARSLLFYAVLLSFHLSDGQPRDSVFTFPFTDTSLEMRIQQLNKFIDSHELDTLATAHASLLLGQEYTTLGFTDLALEKLNTSFVLFKSQNDTLGIVDVLKQISLTYAVVQQYEKAFEFIEQTLKYTSETNNLRQIYSRMGYIYMNLMELDSAEKYLKLSADLYRKTGEFPATPLLNLCGVNVTRGNYTAALNGLLEIEHSGMENNSASGRYFVYNFIRVLYKKIGQLAKSEEYLRKRDSLNTNDKEIKKNLDFYETNVIADTLLKNYHHAVANQQKYIEQLRFYYKNNLTTQLANYQRLFELQEKEGKIELLEKENELHILRQQQNRFYLVIALLGILVLILTVLIIYRTLVIRNRDHRELTRLNAKISLQHEELQKRNTQLEEALENLREKEHQLIQSEKMAFMGSFVSGIAHELNNPINVLNGGLNVIQRNLTELAQSDESQRELLHNEMHVMIRESDLSISKINRIIQALTWATSRDINPLEVDIEEILDNTLLALNLDEYPDITFNVESIPIQIQCYPNRIHRAVRAILENAFHYANQSLQKEKTVTLKVKEFKHKVEIIIENNGPPIPDENLSKIFEPFFTTREDGESPGLGLYFASSAIVEHKGHIAVANRAKKLAFIIHLPLDLSA